MSIAYLIAADLELRISCESILSRFLVSKICHPNFIQLERRKVPSRILDVKILLSVVSNSFNGDFGKPSLILFKQE